MRRLVWAAALGAFFAGFALHFLMALQPRAAMSRTEMQMLERIALSRATLSHAPASRGEDASHAGVEVLVNSFR